MQWITLGLVAVVAVAHVGFLYLEMFLFDTDKGRKIFRTTPEQSASSAALAANQGLYNGFLAAGLIWGILLSTQGAAHAAAVMTFFLACVIVAAAYGAYSVNKQIFIIQGVPAVLALGAVLLG